MVEAQKRNYAASLRRRYQLRLNPDRDRYKKAFMKRKFKKYPTKCDMNMELFPMYYTQVTRSTAFRIAFASSCLPRLEVNFDLYYYKNHHINFYHNPTTVNLNLWGNRFIIDYSKAHVIDKYDIIKSTMYHQADISVLDKKIWKKKRFQRIDITKQNSTFLPPQKVKTFNDYTIKKIDDLDGVCECKLFQKKIRGWKMIKKLRDERLKRKKEAMEKMHKAIRAAIEAQKKRSKRLMEMGRRLKGVKKVKKKNKEKHKYPLPKNFKTKRKHVKKLMLMKYVIDYQINCDII